MLFYTKGAAVGFQRPQSLPWMVCRCISARYSRACRIIIVRGDCDEATRGRQVARAGENRIDAVDGEVFHHRPALARRDWIVVAWRALFPSRRQRRSAASLARAR